MKLGEALARVDGMKPNGHMSRGMARFCNYGRFDPILNL